MILVKCQYCGNKHEYGIKCNCKEKKDIKAKYKNKNRKLNDKNYDKNKRDKERDKFYHSNSWKALRNACVNKFYGLDIYELYKTGNIIPGNIAHHIIEVKDDSNRIYDIDNLILLSASNHIEIHSIYNSSIKEKKEMQEHLLSIINKFHKKYI